MTSEICPSNEDEIDGNEEEEIWSGSKEAEKEVSNGSSEKECDEIRIDEDGTEPVENFEVTIEVPKVGMVFDTTDEAFRHDDICNLAGEVANLVEDCEEKYGKAMGLLRELKEEFVKSSAVHGSDMVSSTPNDSFSLGDGVLPSKENISILDPVPVRRKGRPPTKRKQGVLERIGKRRVNRKNTLCNEKVQEVEANVDGHAFGTQESVANINSYPSYTGELMWPNMTAHNMAQGRTFLPFSPTSCPTGRGFEQSFNNFPTSESYMKNVPNSQSWRGQSSIMNNQVWGGSELSFLGSQGHGFGGQQ